MDKNNILVSGAALYKEVKGKEVWFVVKTQDGEGWELPKTIVRRGESSVRAIMRVMSEKGGMTIRVLEEAGRFTSAVSSNGKPVTQKNIFYLMMLKSSAKETIGFPESQWLEFGKVLKKIKSKKELAVFKKTKSVYKIWKKEKSKRIQQEEEEAELELGL